MTPKSHRLETFETSQTQQGTTRRSETFWKILDQAQKYPGQLSGGQQQRAAIARALCMEPKIMLFDEPTSALDPELIGEVLTVLRNLVKEGMTMLIVTHELGFASNFADKIVFMDAGEIIETGSPKEILKFPKTDRLKHFLDKLSITSF